MAKPILAVLLTHAINCSLRSTKFPTSLKIARILPILKSGKREHDKESYRPISNLHSFEKLFEEHMKRELEKYLEENDIIHDHQHGGRKSRSTMTAKTAIDQELAENYEKGRACSVLSSDLSGAFDSVDHFFLLKKMSFYGIQGKELKFFESFLSDRTCFVEI